MRWQHVTLTPVAFACIVAAPYAEEENADSPESFIEEWVAAFNNNDAERLLAFYDCSQETEVLVSSGFRYRGYEAVQKAYKDDQRQLRYYNSAANEMTSRLLGDTAVVTFEQQFKIRRLADESRWQIDIRTTSVLHRIEGEWKIVLEHPSSISGVDRITQIEE